MAPNLEVTMELSGKSKLFDLFDKYPFLLDWMAEYAPHFSKLKNPILRNTVGRMATLEVASTMGEVPLDKLIRDIQAQIERHSKGSAFQPEPAMNDKQKQEVLKGIIKDLHKGVEMGILKKRFSDLVKDVDPSEISRMEQALINEGMPSDEIKKLCDVHVQLFKETLDVKEKPKVDSGHPVHTFMAENEKIKDFGVKVGVLCESLGVGTDKKSLAEIKNELNENFEKLALVEKHYLRKENQLFPFLEKHGISGPSQVMWAIHDEIRAMVKTVRTAIKNNEQNIVKEKGVALARATLDMIYKEENILFPMSLEMMSEDEWLEIRKGEDEIGYFMVTPGKDWKALSKLASTGARKSNSESSRLDLNTGAMTLEQIKAMLSTLPVDISFVDENDEVRYYSDKKDMIFPRSPGVIGRKVQNCHPPKSLHMVEKIVSEFKAGTKDVARFWMRQGEKLVYIRYFAIRDKNEKYLGTMEVTQEVSEMNKLEGERRLLDWN
jgi:uncharacterized protein